MELPIFTDRLYAFLIQAHLLKNCDQVESVENNPFFNEDFILATQYTVDSETQHTITLSTHEGKFALTITDLNERENP